MREKKSKVLGMAEAAPNDVSRPEILRLIKRREDIDEQITALGGILTSNKIGMSEPLVDQEGYPRTDVNVYQVRHARHMIICLQNDFKALTKEIDQKLQRYHAQLKERGLNEDIIRMDVDDDNSSAESTPIAKVNLVSEGSPAFHAGLLVDDMIVEFGSISSQNFTSLTDIGNLVNSSAGNMISVKVKRESTSHKLALIPGPWNGRGLLGCNIVPYDSVDR